jgi:hypothetical protein
VSSWSASRTEQIAKNPVVPSAAVSIGAEIEPSSGARLRSIQRLDLSAAVALFVVALPVLFLHARYQPTLQLSLGSTQVQARLSDLAVFWRLVPLRRLPRADRVLTHSGMGRPSG